MFPLRAPILSLPETQTERQSSPLPPGISHIRSGCCRVSSRRPASLLGCLGEGVPPAGESSAPSGYDPPDQTYLDRKGHASWVGVSFLDGSCSLAACSFIAVGVVGKAAAVSDRAFHDRAVAKAGGIAVTNSSRRIPPRLPQSSALIYSVKGGASALALPAAVDASFLAACRRLNEILQPLRERFRMITTLSQVDSGTRFAGRVSPEQHPNDPDPKASKLRPLLLPRGALGSGFLGLVSPISCSF